jgi:predicted transcriptional regulator
MTPCTEKNTISPDVDATAALSSMNSNGQSRLMVVENDRLVGIISLKDLLKFLALKMELEEEDAVKLGNGFKNGED